MNGRDLQNLEFAGFGIDLDFGDLCSKDVGSDGLPWPVSLSSMVVTGLKLPTPIGGRPLPCKP